MDYIINTRLLTNPLNWITVGTIAALTLMAILAVSSHAGSGAPTASLQPET